MKKLVLVLMAVAVLGSLSFAQKGAMSLGGGLGLFMPMGDFADVANMGFGIIPQFEYTMNEKINLTGNIGYVSWGGESINLGSYGTWEYSFHDIPILAGAKYYFGEGKMKPYGMAKFGMHMFGVTVKVAGISESASETYFGFDFGGGMEMPINEKMHFDMAGAFQTIMSEGSSSNNLVIFAGIKYLLK